MRSQITFSHAIDGYLLYAESRRRSAHTLTEYQNTFAKFALFIGIDKPPKLNADAVRQWIVEHSQIHRFDQKNLNDLWQLCIARQLIADVPVADISHQTVEAFLASFDGLSQKTILNYHVGLSALWRWLDKEGLVADNIMRHVDPPKPKKPVVKPYTEDEIRRVLAACQYNAEYSRNGNRPVANRRKSEMRDVAIILLLVDSGIRSQELCDLEVRDVDLKARRLLVRSGKGDKERYAYFSARTGRALWRWLNSRDDSNNPNAPMFITGNYTRLSESGLLQFVHRAGKRAGITGANVHRFRHTFAIQALRNGMSAYVLQDLLGHSSMDMVRRYLRVAEVDLSAGHHQASPVDNWRL